MNTVTAAVEDACQQARHKPLADTMKEMVEAFVDVKMERADISVALYRVYADVGGPDLAKKTRLRLHKTIEKMLETAPDLKSHPDGFAIDLMVAAMSGAMRSVLEAGGPLAMMRRLREHLILLCQSYMVAATSKGK